MAAAVMLAVQVPLGLRAEPARAGLPAASAPPSGVIETRALYLEAPPAVLAACPRPDQQPLWRLPVVPEGELRTWLTEAGMSAALQAELLTPAVLKADGHSLTLVVPPALVLQLSADVRQAWYSRLAGHPANHFFASPVLIPGDLEAWLADSRLSTRQRDWVRQLVWRRGRCTAFSDVSLLVNLAGSLEEEAAAVSLATRVRALVATVRLPAVPQRPAFFEYWSAGGRNPDAVPFLRAVAEQAEGVAVDLLHLLPPLCRETLYTYPSLADISGGRLPDCQWTSLNFFAPRPAPYFLNPGASYLELTQGHEEIPAPERLGDLICYVRADGAIVHSCVLVAGDLVFTKNGSSITAPWLLQTKAEVDLIYLVQPGDQVRFFRRLAAVPGR